MGNRFSFVSVRFQPQTPEWFPQQQLSAYLADSYKHKSSDATEKELFDFFSNKIKKTSYTTPIDIKCKKYFFNWFSTVYVTLNTLPHPIMPVRIKGAICSSPHIRPGVNISTGYTWPPNTLRTTFQFFTPTIYNIRFSIKKPDFKSTSSLSEERPVPYSLYQLSDSHTRMSSQRFQTTGIEYSYFSRNLSRVVSTSASHIINHSSGKNDAILYYDPQSYNKLSFVFQNLFSTASQRAEAAFLSLPGSFLPLPYLKFQNQNIFCFPNYLKAYIDSGALLSASPVPLKERLHVGGPPFARGIPSCHFSNKSCGIPHGCDFYVAGGFETLVRLLPKLDFHFFVNAGISVLTKSTFFLDFTPSFSAFASYGCGYVYHFKNGDCELNFNVPFMTTKGLKFDRFQWSLVVK